jgi:release factor glutamine methyltransferase
MLLLKKRYTGHPIAYLTGTREFWSRDFITTPDVLIPRPETELLIELCLELMPDNTPRRLIDLGTGSGAIAITLAAERPAIEVTATDYSAKALTIARQNARQLGINNIQFCQSYWFDSVAKSEFDIIVSNPPYIAPNDPHLHEGDLRFEPTMALIAEQQGLQDIHSIAKTASAFLNPGGRLLIEHGYDQQEQVQSIFANYPYTNIQTHTDLSSLPRVTSARAT